MIVFLAGVCLAWRTVTLVNPAAPEHTQRGGAQNMRGASHAGLGLCLSLLDNSASPLAKEVSHTPCMSDIQTVAMVNWLAVFPSHRAHSTMDCSHDLP